MVECNKVAGGDTIHGMMGKVWDHGLDVELPQFCGGGALACEDNMFVRANGDGYGGECNITSSIAQLTN